MREKVSWLYLYDRPQDVARKYGFCERRTFFCVRQKRKLVYTGRGMDNPRDTSKMTVNDLDNALSDLLAGRPIRTPDQSDRMQCQMGRTGCSLMPADACDLV